MRLMLTLAPTKVFVYDKNYYHKLHGFIYSLLKGTPYEVLHDKPGFKFFCFSNPFPIKDFNPTLKTTILISSPDKVFLKFISDKLREKMDKNEAVHIGEMEFFVEEIKAFSIKLKNNARLISATPIIIRIPERNYDKYNIPHEKRKKRYVYWRPEYDFSAFLKQLEENIFKKYKEFYKTGVEEFPVFEQFKFRKPVALRPVIKGKEQLVVGSLWEFYFSGLKYDRRKKKLLEFAIDCGFGERNPYGFGFINEMKMGDV